MDDHPSTIIILSLLFSAFFSGIELAFVSANKLKIEIEKKKGLLSSKIYGNLMQHPSRFITTMLLGNNISLVVYGLAMAIVLEPFFNKWVSNDVLVLFLQTVVSTLIILFVAEFLPKVIFSKSPNRTLRIFAIPVVIIYYLFYPLVSFIISLSNVALRYFFGVKNEDEEVDFNLLDLDHLLKEVSSDNDSEDELSHEIQILQNVLEFSSVKARECMVPRNEITALSIDDSMEKLKEVFLETGHSKVLIYRDTIDNIIGYVHSSELFKRPKSIKNILLPISVVPETMPADEIMELLIKQKRSLAVVVDEYGGTAGILTLEDVVEEIFGEIEDEHDTDDLIEKKISDNEYIFSARIEVDHINEEYHLDIPESDNYETLAGFIIEHYASIPKDGEEIEIGNFLFKILSVSGNRIELVRLTVKSSD